MTNNGKAGSNGDKPAKPEPATSKPKTDQTPPRATETPLRSKARRNVVGGSPHRDEYVRLMQAGWSSPAIEKYAMFRYGEDMPERTIRAYRKRRGIKADGPLYSPQVFDQPIDVLTARADLIALQRERVLIDVTHERTMQKLFGTTKAEIALLSTLLGEHKVDLQDLGLLPKVGVSMDVNVRTSPDEAPRAASLADLFGADPAAEAELAKVLHLRARETG